MEPAEKLNPIIEHLSRIDKLAAEESAKAGDKKEALLDDFENQKADYSAALKAQLEERLAALKEELDKETAEKIAAVREEYAARAARLDEEYERNGETWAENIFNAIIEG